MPQQRDRFDIIKDILEIVYDTEPLYRNQMNQTRIGYEVGLTHPQTVKYLKMLVRQGLLVLRPFKPVPFYEITNKGPKTCSLKRGFSNMDIET
jgi:predicted transcriptional regulator